MNKNIILFLLSTCASPYLSASSNVHLDPNATTYDTSTFKRVYSEGTTTSSDDEGEKVCPPVVSAPLPLETPLLKVEKPLDNNLLAQRPKAAPPQEMQYCRVPNNTPHPTQEKKDNDVNKVST